MTDTAAAAPSTATPNTADPGISTPAGGVQSGGGGANAAAVQQARVDLAAMDPNTIVTIVSEGKTVEMRAGDAFKRLGREFTANKRFEEASRTRQEAASDRAEAERAVQRIASALGDPAEFGAMLAEYGISREQWFAAMSQHHEAEQRLSPAERELREMKRAQAQREQEAQTAQQQQHAAQVQQAQAGYAAVFGELMTVEGIPADHVARDVLMPTLARAMLYMQETEGRNLKKSEARSVIRNAIHQFGGLARPSAEQRLANLTDDDIRLYMERKNAAATGRQAAPELRPRDEHNGRYLPGDPRGAAERRAQVRTNVHGKPIVKDPFGLFGR